MITKPQGVVSLILAFVGLLNFALSALGISPIPVDADSVTLFVTLAFTLVGTIGTAWNNFNVTNAAQLGDKLIDNIKDGNIDYALADQLIRDLVKSADAIKANEAKQ